MNDFVGSEICLSSCADASRFDVLPVLSDREPSVSLPCSSLWADDGALGVQGNYETNQSMGGSAANVIVPIYRRLAQSAFLVPACGTID